MKNYILRYVNERTIMLAEEDEDGIIYKLYLISTDSFGKEFTEYYDELKRDVYSQIYITQDMFEFISHDRHLYFF
jgi:hypothetical protein